MRVTLREVKEAIIDHNMEFKTSEDAIVMTKDEALTFFDTIDPNERVDVRMRNNCIIITKDNLTIRREERVSRIKDTIESLEKMANEARGDLTNGITNEFLILRNAIDEMKATLEKLEE